MLTFSRLGTAGRLGNQLFQVAFITSFSARYGVKYTLPYWHYGEHFNHAFNYHYPDEEITYDLIIKEPDLSYNEEYFKGFLPQMKTLNVNIIKGFFQSHKYFNKEHILKIFAPRKEQIEKINTEKCVAISVRRGDFVKHSMYNNIEAEIFRNALQEFKNHKVFIFTDDYRYCKQEFVGPQYEFPEDLNDIGQLLLMRTFKKFILSNSTFSYWGAMMSDAPKIVLYPEFMFPDMKLCEIYNKYYWPHNSIYQSYANPITK